MTPVSQEPSGKSLLSSFKYVLLACVVGLYLFMYYVGSTSENLKEYRFFMRKRPEFAQLGKLSRDWVWDEAALCQPMQAPQGIQQWSGSDTTITLQQFYESAGASQSPNPIVHNGFTFQTRFGLYTYIPDLDQPPQNWRGCSEAPVNCERAYEGGWFDCTLSAE